MRVQLSIDSTHIVPSTKKLVFRLIMITISTGFWTATASLVVLILVCNEWHLCWRHANKYHSTLIGQQDYGTSLLNTL